MALVANASGSLVVGGFVVWFLSLIYFKYKIYTLTILCPLKNALD